MKRLGFVVVVVCLLTLGAGAVAVAAQAAASQSLPISATFPGIGGNRFEPGQEVVISWKLEGSEVKSFETNPWGECELLFSSDAGRTWTRITPQLSVTRRDFTWVVPDVPTRSAKLALQIGIEGEGEFYQFASKRFAIAETRGAPAVRFEGAAPGEIAAGSELDLRWSSTVSDVVRYEVSISSDLGAHFFRVGETRGTEFSYAVPADYEGSLTVQIVAQRRAGAPIRSALDERSTFRVRRAAD